MSDGKEKPDSVEIINAATDLVKAVPIYPDLIQPAARELGKTFGTLAKAINVALAPVSAMVWGYEKIGDFISREMEQKLKCVPIENISSPNPIIAGATIEALRFAGSDEILRELYTNLLASSMNASLASSAHPSFVEVIKQLSHTEAQLIQKLSTLSSFPEICSTTTKDTMKAAIARLVCQEAAGSEKITGEFNRICVNLYKEGVFDLELDNLLRLRILDHEKNTSQKFKDREWEAKENSKIADFLEDVIQIEVSTSDLIKFTSYGREFVKVCVGDGISFYQGD